MSKDYHLKDSEDFYRYFLAGIILYEKINQMLDSKTGSLNKRWAEKTDSYMKKSIERLTK